MKNNRRLAFSLRAAVLVAAGLGSMAMLAGCAHQSPVAKSSSGWVKDQVADAYVFGYPLVASDISREKATGGDGARPGQSPVNTLRHGTALPPVGVAGRPSLDTVDSAAWIDVASGPVVVSLPNAMRGRYYDVRAFDMWTNVLYSSADTTPYPKATGLAFVPAGFTGAVPDGTTRVETPTRYVWLSIRVRVFGPRDLREARKLQTAMTVEAPAGARTDSSTAGSAWPNATATNPAPVSADDQPDTMDPSAYFNRLATALTDNPPAPNDPHAIEQLGELGVKAGEPVQFQTADAKLLADGVADGRARIDTLPSNATSRNGWVWFTDGVGAYDSDYTLRAFIASHRPASGTKSGEIQPVARADSDGHPLNGANVYVLHFRRDQLPPVRGFWSLTAYTKDGALLDAKVPRLTLNDRDRLRKNRDGSVDILLEARSPGKARVANWLPVPEGDFQLMLRLYAPKPQANDGTWSPPAIERQ
jgi:hypothetical protein